ncbi:DUF3857 domain-containing protein [Agaribacterium sp. ZY112]|uniref:DUF3857 domain-containing protein n=1 Tax=Agaribacterium sp. ZY112 TaxID=3233574 RepID=UPI003524B697
MGFKTFAITSGLIVITLLFSGEVAFANQSNIDTAEANVKKTKAAPWVIDNTIPSTPESRLTAVSNGILYKLSDRQIKWLPDGFEFYSRYVYQVTDRSGLEFASKLSQGFDPEDTELAFNFIRITRDGKTADRLPNADITILRQEEELDTDIIDGNLTALIVLDDVRKGDIIDYAVSGRVKYKLWPGEFFDTITLGWSVPVGESRYKLIWPKDRHLNTKNFLTDIEPEITEEENNRTYSWTVSDPNPIPAEEGTPAWVYSWPTVSLSTMNKWEDIQSWAEPYYKISSELPDNFKQQLKTIRKKWPAPKDQMTEALRLVQKEIRYVGIEIGLGSHVPRPPEEVLRRGYGDCKDKSMLLVAALKNLNIKAWPALVNYNMGPGLPQELPSPFAFNHAIVKVKIKNEVFWLDPTLSYQGGRGSNIEQPAYDYGLPIGGKKNGLEKIETIAPTSPTLYAQENFLIPEEGNSGLDLEIITTYRGYEADSERRLIASQSLEEYQRSYLNYYNGTFNGIDIKSPISIDDDIDKNVIIIKGAFFLSQEQAEKLEIKKEISLNAWAVNGLFYQPSQTSRRTELLMPYLTNRAHQITITLPGHRPLGIAPTIEKIDSGFFKRTFMANKETLKIDFQVVNNSSSISANESIKAIKLSEKINENANLNFHVDQVQQSLSGIFKIKQDTITPYEDQITESFLLFNDKKLYESLKILNGLEKEVTEKNRLRGLIQTMRGEVLISLNRKTSGIIALEEALPLYRDLPTTYFLMAGIYRQKNEPEKESSVLTLLAQEHPNSASGIRSKSLYELNIKLSENDKDGLFDELALKLAKANYKSSEDDEWIYERAIKSLDFENPQDSIDEAKPYIEKIISPYSLLKLMTNKKYKKLWPLIEDYAGKDLSVAINRNIEITKTEFHNDRKNYIKIAAYVDALHTSGRMVDAIKTAKPYIEDWDSIEAEGKDAFWLVNSYAYLLNDIGKHDEAINILNRITSLPISDFPDSINMRINQSIILIGQGKYKEALEFTKTINREYASEYGQMFIDLSRSCALYKLNKKEESKAIINNMSKIKNKNIAAYSRALACTQNDDLFESTIIDRLNNPTQRSSAIPLFISKKRLKKSGDLNLEEEDYYNKMLSKTSIKEAFDKYGRIIKVDKNYVK